MNCWKTALFVASFLLGGVSIPASAETYATPRSHRTDALLNEGWRFTLEDTAGAQEIVADDSAWAFVSLPHTWEVLEQPDDHGNQCTTAWYRRHFSVPASDAGRRAFLKFHGACATADVWVNGRHAGQHQGGFTAFTFDVTDYIRVGADNILAVRVRSVPASIPPSSSDSHCLNGIYRDVHLLVTDPVHISPLDHGSQGVYLETLNVSSNSAMLRVVTVVSNATAEPQPVRLRAVITDAKSRIVATLTNLATLSAAASSNLTATTLVVQPHLWEGLRDPYLYRVSVEVLNGSRVNDCVSQPLGFRSFRVDAQKGAFLNGRHVDLHGVSLHEDGAGKAWAIGHAQRQTNFALLKELGATALRLSHYEQSDDTYCLADRAGILLWCEVPVTSGIADSPGIRTNAAQQLRDFIRQHYNHPSVICWGIDDQIALNRIANTAGRDEQMAKVITEEDAARPAVATASADGNDPANCPSEIVSFKRSFDEGCHCADDLGLWADKMHAAYPSRCIGLTECGGGESAWPPPRNPLEHQSHGDFQPDKHQNLLHESHWQQVRARPYLWCKFVGTLFDLVADNSDANGFDTTVVTRDRASRKDPFYWYQANWATTPMVHITGHNSSNQHTNSLIAKVYANCDSAELSVNGRPLGSRRSTNCIFTWPVLLRPGCNLLEALGKKGHTLAGDFVVWYAPGSAPALKSADAKKDMTPATHAPTARAATDPLGN